MKHHNGVKRTNKLDGGKGKARKAHSRAVRRAGKVRVEKIDVEAIADEIFKICTEAGR